jgi:hypothetical protein
LEVFLPSSAPPAPAGSVGAPSGATGDGVGDAAVTRNSIQSTIHKNEPDENFVRLASS